MAAVISHLRFNKILKCLPLIGKELIINMLDKQGNIRSHMAVRVLTANQ